MKKVIIFFSFFVLSTSVFALPEKPHVKSLSLSLEGTSKVELNMNEAGVRTWIFYDYAMIRVPKKPNLSLVQALITDESLAYCEVVAVLQSRDTVYADVLVSFKVENDGGYNSCDVTVSLDDKKRTVILGAEVGE
jgi:hypothetical protein